MSECPVDTFRIWDDDTRDYGYEAGCADHQQHVCLVKTRTLFMVGETARGVAEGQYVSAPSAGRLLAGEDKP